MINKIYKRLYWFLKVLQKFPFKKVLIKGSSDATFDIGNGVKLNNVTIAFAKGAKLILEDNVILENLDISIKGIARIGANTKIYSSKIERNYFVVDGSFSCGINNRLETNVRIRYGGNVEIGDYNNINFGSEIRCDELVKIGSFNQISYFVMIWDTNTHNIYDAETRRELTITKGIGYEFEKPKTKPVIIGDDCWIGKSVSILKGVTVGNKCIVGYNVLLTDNELEDNTTIVSDNKYKIFKNKI